MIMNQQLKQIFDMEKLTHKIINGEILLCKNQNQYCTIALDDFGLPYIKKLEVDDSDLTEEVNSKYQSNIFNHPLNKFKQHEIKSYIESFYIIINHDQDRHQKH